MGTVKLTINGHAVEAPAGSTLLAAATAAGIEIPTLCQHPTLPSLGACRICLVEVGKQAALQPACTYPVSEGLEVQTETPRVVAMRKFVLEMLFSERNHYCMFCELSGDCELQALAYRYGLDHWTYPSPNPRLPVDGTRKYFLMDHNRCILCRRCVRACDDLVANHTLGVKQRGVQTMICADLDAPFGESSCVSCGTCLQVCPTGALVDRRSAFKGRQAQVEVVPSACTFCAVGCRTKIVTRAGHVLRVEGDWDGPNGGVLCEGGRFAPVYDTRPRIEAPLVRKGGELQPVGWDEALSMVAGRLKDAAGGRRIKAWVTGNALNETMQAFVALFRDKLGAAVATLEQTLGSTGLPTGGTLEDLDRTDCLLVVSAHPLDEHRVLGYRLRRARERGASLIVVSDHGNQMGQWATHKLASSELDEAIKLVQAARRPVVIYGAGLSPAKAERLLTLTEKAIFIPLPPATNGLGARALGLHSDPAVEGVELAFLLMKDRPLADEAVRNFRKARSIIIQATYPSALSEFADIVLPASLWHERQGTFTNLEGRQVEVAAATAAPEWFRPEAEVLRQLGERV